MDSNPPMRLPTWVQKTDGRIVPFDADQINRTLFLATERHGQPDAFLARELTDSVLHFLAEEADGNTVHSRQIQETVLKVVRQLGQLALAAALADVARGDAAQPVNGGRVDVKPSERQVWAEIESGKCGIDLMRRAGAAALEEFSLEYIFSKNLAAAHRDGLMHLGGLDAPLELSAAVLSPALSTRSRTSAATGIGGWRSPAIFETIEHSRQHLAGTLALDAPERELAQREMRIGETGAYLRELRLAARSCGLRVVLNIGSETTPEWAKGLAEGPLFGSLRMPEGKERVLGHVDALVEQVLAQSGVGGWALGVGGNQSLAPSAQPLLRLDWHVSGRDFADESGRARLTRLIRAALYGTPVAFVCDRPRSPVSLAEGLDRRHPAALLWVTMNLPALLERQKPEKSPDLFLTKLVRLARLAVSAGAQKREFLRRHERRDRPAFLLDRAHLVIHLAGLGTLVEQLFAATPWQDEGALAFVQQMLRHLEETASQEARQTQLISIIETEIPDSGRDQESSGGDWRNVLRAAGQVHAMTGRGTVLLPIDDEQVFEPSELVETLHFAWKHTGVNRIRLCSHLPVRTQLSVAW